MSLRFAEEIEMEKASRKFWKRLVKCLAKRQLRKDGKKQRDMFIVETRPQARVAPEMILNYNDLGSRQS